MTEYTFAVVVGFLVVIALDRVLQTKIIRFTPRLFYTTLVFLVFQLMLDNYFTAQGLWAFNTNETLGIMIPFIPLENLFFGMEMLWFTLILFSFFSREKGK